MLIGLIGALVGGVTGFVVTPAPIYTAEQLIQCSASKATVLVSEEESRSMSLEFQRSINLTLAIVEDPKLAEGAFGKHVPSQASKIRSPDDLRSRLRAEHLSRTELIKIRLEDTSEDDAGLFLKQIVADVNQRIVKLGLGHRVSVIVQNGPICFVTSEWKAFTSWGMIVGAIVALVAVAANYYFSRKRGFIQCE